MNRVWSLFQAVQPAADPVRGLPEGPGHQAPAQCRLRGCQLCPHGAPRVLAGGPRNTHLDSRQDSWAPQHSHLSRTHGPRNTHLNRTRGGLEEKAADCNYENLYITWEANCCLKLWLISEEVKSGICNSTIICHSSFVHPCFRWSSDTKFIFENSFNISDKIVVKAALMC